MDVKYKRDYNHNFLIISGCGEADYQSKVVSENKIPGLLDTHIVHTEEADNYFYEISSRQALVRVFEKREMKYDDVCRLIRSLASTFHLLQEYLLDPDKLWLCPEYIYLDMETESTHLVFCPEVVPQENGIAQLADFILNRVDHEDKKSVIISYQLYKLSKEDNFIFDDILSAMETVENSADKEVLCNELPEKVNLVSTEEENTVGTQIIEEKNTVSNNQMLLKISIVASVIACGIFAVQLCVHLSYGITAFAIAVCIITWGIYFLSRRGKSHDEVSEEYETKTKEEYGCTYEQMAPNKESALPQEGTVLLFDASTLGRRCLVPDNADSGKEIDLGKLPILVGKMENSVDFVLSDSSVSRLHCRFFEEGGKVFMEDLNSTNGCFINDIRLNNEVVSLDFGDEIRIGNCLFHYR